MRSSRDIARVALGGGIVAVTVDGMTMAEWPSGLKMLDDGIAHHIVVRLGDALMKLNEGHNDSARTGSQPMPLVSQEQ